MASSADQTVAVEKIEEQNRASDIITSLQVLTSNIANGHINDEAATTVDKVDQKVVKPKLKRGRKKKSPQKPCQLPILPKMFAIQIAPQANVLAPVNTLINSTLLPSPVKQPLPSTQPSTSDIVSKIPSRQVEMENNKVTSATTSKPAKRSKRNAKTIQESIELAGKFHYASNDSKPAKFQSKDIVLSGGFPQQNRKRIVHNATEKRRKEKINGWIGKIAKVLFKYNPEQQHKIYILEKAYDFISERSGKQPENGKHQDAFTQSVSSEASGFPQLVRKIAELENLVDILIRLLNKYKIPTPDNVLTSSYVQSKHGSMYSNSNEASFAAQSNNFDGSAENSSQIVTHGHMTSAEAETQAILTSALCNKLDSSNHQPLPNISSECLLPSKSFILVSKTQEEPVASSVLDQGSNVVLESINVNTRSINGDPVVTDATRLNTGDATPQSVTNIMPESSVPFPVSGIQANSCMNPGLQLMLSCEDNLANVSSQSNDLRINDESQRGNQLVSNHPSNTQVSEFSTSLSTIGSIASAEGLPIASSNVSFVIGKSSENSVLGNSVGATSYCLASLASSLENNITISSTNGNDLFVQSASTMNGIPVRDVANSTNVTKQSKCNSTVKSKASKAPTMKSQMFVMKNMVASKSKSTTTASLFDKICNSPQVLQLNTTTRAPDSMPILSNDITMPINCIPLPPIDDSPEIDRMSQNTTLSEKPSSQKSHRKAFTEDTASAKNPANKHTETTWMLNGNSSMPALANMQEFNSLVQTGQIEPRQNQQQFQTVHNTPSVPSLRSRHSVTSLLSNSNYISNENQTLSIDNILTKNSAMPNSSSKSTGKSSSSGSKTTSARSKASSASFKASSTSSKAVSTSSKAVSIGNKTTPASINTSLFANPAGVNSNAMSTQRYPQKLNSNTNVSRKRTNSDTAENQKIICGITNDTSDPKALYRIQQKRPKRTTTSTSQKTSTTTCFNSASGLVSNSQKSNAMPTDGKSKTHKTELKSQKSNKDELGQSLPRPHSIVSLARNQHRRPEDGLKRNNGLSGFSTESLLRSNPECVSQSSQPILHNTHMNVTQDCVLPTILNIFAPASIGNMVNPVASLGNINNPQNQVATPVANITLPTIQSTLSNFSAEALIGGSVDSQQGLHNDHMLSQQENQNLFTDFSTDTLLAGTESSLSYGIDNIMNRSESSISTSCISPNWLQTGPLIDNSPIRNSFNLGFNIFESTTGPQGHKAATSNPSFLLPGKWRPENNKPDDGNVNIGNQSSMWGPTGLAASQKTLKTAPQKQGQKNMMKIQHGNKRGPSYGDFLLVDSTS